MYITLRKVILPWHFWPGSILIETVLVGSTFISLSMVVFYSSDSVFLIDQCCEGEGKAMKVKDFEEGVIGKKGYMYICMDYVCMYEEGPA